MGVKTDIKRQTFRVANFPSVVMTLLSKRPFNYYNILSMLNYQAKLQTQVGLKFLREVLIR